MPTVVFSPTVPWAWMKQRPQQLAHQFAVNGWQVYYCETSPPGGAEPAVVAPNIFIIRDRPSFVRNLLFWTPGPRLLWHSRPQGGTAFTGRGFDAEIYDCLDDFPAWRPYEDRLLHRLDWSFASSRPILARLRRLGLPVTLLRNACAYEELAGVPARYPPVTRPRREVGYVGALAHWVDLELLAATARLRPGLDFWCLGAVRPGAPSVDPPANLRIYDHVPHDWLPYYLSRASVTVVPFKVDSRAALAADPVKVYEYLAAGKPVVATRLPELDRLGDLVYRADTPAAFAGAIDEALAADRPQLAADRRAFARANTWRHRYLRLSAVLRRLPGLGSRLGRLASRKEQTVEPIAPGPTARRPAPRPRPAAPPA